MTFHAWLTSEFLWGEGRRGVSPRDAVVGVEIAAPVDQAVQVLVAPLETAPCLRVAPVEQWTGLESAGCGHAVAADAVREVLLHTIAVDHAAISMLARVAIAVRPQAAVFRARAAGRLGYTHLVLAHQARAPYPAVEERLARDHPAAVLQAVLASGAVRVVLAGRRAHTEGT